MRYYFVLSLLLTSCFSTSEQAIVQRPSAKRQKQKIAVLQKKLEVAAKEQIKVQTEVARLASEIDLAMLSLIHGRVDKYERNKEPVPSLFLEERESLYRMIQTGPSPSAFEAQVELDRILRLITERSDE